MKTYYAHMIKDQAFEPFQGRRTTIPGYPDIEAWYRKDKFERFIVSEVTSGAKLAHSTTLKAARQLAGDRAMHVGSAEAMARLIAGYVRKYGPAPAPEEGK